MRGMLREMHSQTQIPSCRLDACSRKQSAKEEGLLCAEWCVHVFPEFEWAPVVGLVHDLGRLLSHPLCVLPLLCTAAKHGAYGSMRCWYAQQMLLPRLGSQSVPIPVPHSTC